MKAAIAVLDFILSNAAKHNVDGESLSSELQQLGLPKGGAWDGDMGPCSHTSAASAALLCPAQSYSEQCTMLAVLSCPRCLFPGFLSPPLFPPC